MSSQRRNFFRVYVTFPVTVWAFDGEGAELDPFTAEVQDLSAGGTLIRGDQQLRAGQAVRLALVATDPPLEVEAAASVVRSWKDENGRTLSALQFDPLPDADQSAVLRYCNTAQRVEIERRLAMRATVELPVMIEIAGTQVHGYTIDLSADSALISTQATAAPGAQVRVTFAGDERTAVDATVTHVAEGRLGVEYPNARRVSQTAIVQVALAEERRIAQGSGS
jgi:hypothetical protein